MTDNRRGSTGFVWVLLVLGMLAVMAVFLYRMLAPGPQDPPETPAQAEPAADDTDIDDAVETQTQVVDVPTVEYAVDSLEIDAQRQAYQSGDMWLRIEALDYEGPVLDGVDDATLADGVGLFDQAKLPSLGNPNTSIAGHRDVSGCEFYYLDLLGDGDTMTLEWDGYVFTYAYVDTVIVEETDWSSFYCFDRPLLTLMTCHPLGTSEQRMIVSAELVSVQPAG